jgi:flagellar biosynthesis GTPase FlhF
MRADTETELGTLQSEGAGMVTQAELDTDAEADPANCSPQNSPCGQGCCKPFKCEPSSNVCMTKEEVKAIKQAKKDEAKKKKAEEKKKKEEEKKQKQQAAKEQAAKKKAEREQKKKERAAKRKQERDKKKKDRKAKRDAKKKKGKDRKKKRIRTK